MAQRCKVCQHPRSEEINKRIRSGQKYSQIAEEFGLVPSSISRHWKNHLHSRNEVAEALGTEAVAEAVERKIKEAGGKSLSRQDVVDVIETVVSSDMRHFMEWDEEGRVKLKHSARVGPAALAIKTFKRVGNQIVPVLYDKSPLLRLLGAELGLTTEREAQTIRIVHGSPEGEEAMDLPPVKVVRGQVTDGNGDGEEGGDP